MFVFHYRRISASLVKEIKDAVSNGDSVALLGPRYMGKGFVMKSLREELEREDETPVVWVDLPRLAPIATERALFDIVLNAVNETLGQNLTAEFDDDLFSPIDQLTSELEKPAIVLFPYVDGIPHSLARTLLRAVRSRVMAGRIIAVLCGEMDLRYLVHGPNSEFNCTHQYVLQGYELEEFTTQLLRYARMLNLQFRDEAEAAARIWHLTGGNVHVTRILLGSILEVRVRATDAEMLLIETSDIPLSIHEIQPPGMRRSEVFRYPLRLINYDPECWGDLEKLINHHPAEIARSPEDPPSHLELAGAAVREGTHLRFISPMIEQFLRHHYDVRRFGDLYARFGQWDEAFRCYEQLTPEERLRPSSSEDRSNVIPTVKAFSAGLYSKAAKGVEEVKRFFALGCHYILGFSEVTFWQRNEDWAIQPLEGFPSYTKADELIARGLPSNNVRVGWLDLPKHWNAFGAVAILPTLRTDRQGAVVVGNYEKRVVISRERETLTKDLLGHFVEAYSHAIAFEQAQLRLEVRNKHIAVINSIFEGLGRDVLNPKQVLALAASGLRRLGYRRVLFCLVDAERKRIKGVLDDSDDPTVDVAAMTDYALDKPEMDLQPWVISIGQSVIIKDASQEALANQQAVERARMQAEAIVPIINLAGLAIGTIHVERTDGAVPTLAEADDLMTFGRQLAVAIEQSERVSLLQSALDKIPEPLVIVDNAVKIRYANQPGADLLNAKLGWRDRTETANAPQQELGEDLQRMVRESLSQKQRAVHHVQQLLNQAGHLPEDRREVLTDILQDWQNKVIGGLLHIRDMSYLYRASQAFRLVFEATDAQSAISAMLEAAKLLKYKWGRLYLIDENDPERLVSKLSFGFKDKDLEARFNGGQTKLPRRSAPNVETWMSIEQGTPLVFYFTRQLPDRCKYVTPYGLEAIVINQTQKHEELEKNEDDFWLDIPLGTGNTPLGKMTLDCDKDLRPENFEIMKMLLDIASSTLAAHLRRDRATSEKMNLIKVATAEKIMASLAHNVATRLASMPLLLARYRAREHNPAGLKSLNDDFEQLLEDTLTTIKRAKERLATVAVKTEKVDLHSQIRRTLRSALPDECLSVESATQPFEAQVDSHLLELALLELVQNSREMAPAEHGVRILVRLETERLSLHDWVRIIYQDNGPGVPNDLKKTIFEDFFSRRPNKKTGTGLGLGFVRRVIEAHGGVIAETGEEGKGARFILGFPKEQNEAPRKENGYVSSTDH